MQVGTHLCLGRCFCPRVNSFYPAEANFCCIKANWVDWKRGALQRSGYACNGLFAEFVCCSPGWRLQALGPGVGVGGWGKREEQLGVVCIASLCLQRRNILLEHHE